MEESVDIIKSAHNDDNNAKTILLMVNIWNMNVSGVVKSNGATLALSLILVSKFLVNKVTWENEPSVQSICWTEYFV